MKNVSEEKKRKLCGVLLRPVNKEVIRESLGSHSEGCELVLSGLWEKGGFVAHSCFQKHENVAEFHNHGRFPGAQDSGQIQHWRQQHGELS